MAAQLPHESAVMAAIGSHSIRRWFTFSLLALFLTYMINDLGPVQVVPTPTSYSLKGYLKTPASPSHRPSSHNGQKEKPNEPLIPRRVWQVFFPPAGGPTDQQVSVIPQWAQKAAGYTYTILAEDGGEEFVAEHYSTSTLQVLRELRNPALKSDLLRYMVLAVEGGYYGDLDARPLMALEDWVAPEQRSKVGLLISPEHDDGFGADTNTPRVIPYEVQFGQWCIAAAPGHPVLRRMVDRAIAGLKDLAELQGESLGTIHPNDDQVLNATGPWPWTQILWEYLREADPEIRDWRDLSQLYEPRLVGDVLVLPLTAFRGAIGGEVRFFQEMGERRLIDHGMWGTWRGGG